MLHVRHYPDDLCGGRVGSSQTDLMADQFAAAGESLRQRFADDDPARCGAVVTCVERTAGDNRDPHYIEVGGSRLPHDRFAWRVVRPEPNRLAAPVSGER